MKVAILCASIASARAIELTIRGGKHEHAFSETDARRTLELLALEKPDLLILDAELRAPTSAELTRSARAHSACAVLLVARAEPSTSVVYDAMASGALDVTRCPALNAQGELTDHEPLLGKLRTVARLLGRSESQQVDQRLGQKQGGLNAPPQTGLAGRVATTKRSLVALGASTGGPQALHHILCALPSDLQVAFVIVQHLDSTLMLGLADWLQSATRLRVVLATAGSRPTAGTVQLAASNDHLVMTSDGSFHYVDEPRDLTHRPSIDVLFSSLALHWPTPGVAALLTGMGRDGATGLKQLRARGWHTLAQDEHSSVVYGMPKAAAELGAAERVLSLNDIAPAIEHACSYGTMKI